MSKYRLSFVTNSSSSSFLCEICGHMESGYDMGASELGFAQCCNGHTFCEDHRLSPEITKEQLMEELKDKVKYYQQYSDDKWYKDQIEEHEQRLSLVPEMNEDKVTEEYLALFDGLPKEFCPICMLDEVRKEDILMYIEKKTDVKTSQVKLEIRQKFKDLSELRQYLKGE